MHFVGLEEQGRVPVVDYFGVSLQGLRTECEELETAAEENRCDSFLVVCVVAGVEHLDPLLASFEQTRRYRVA